MYNCDLQWCYKCFWWSESCSISFFIVLWFYMEDHNAACVLGDTVQFITPVTTWFFQFLQEQLDVYISCQDKPSGLCDHLLLHMLLTAWLPVLIHLHTTESCLFWFTVKNRAIWLLSHTLWELDCRSPFLCVLNFSLFSIVGFGTSKTKGECVDALTSNQKLTAGIADLIIPDFFFVHLQVLAEESS